MAESESLVTYELSLKNIYRLLKQKDYPDFSDSVIPAPQMKGMTLLKFWESILISEFTQGKTGSIIWKKSEGRNRYKSDICNRSERLGYYEKYAEEIFGVVDQAVILKQIKVFEEFLARKQYSPEILREKLSRMLEYFKEKDSCYTDEVADYFRVNFNQAGRKLTGGKNGQLFTYSWMLTMLTIHALVGSQMCGKEAQTFRENRMLGLLPLAEHFLREERNRTCRFLTGANSELPSSGLSKYHFFGRDEEMLNLLEMMRQGGRYLLYGLGGIGKTEILRQFVAQCKEELIFPEIAVIPYYDSLGSSFIVAFPNARGERDDEKLYNIFYYLSQKDRKQTLLILDNVDPGVESDPLYEEMLKLPISILISSRAARLKGFCGYEISTLSPEDGLKVFRDKYFMPLTELDKELFLDFLKDVQNRHTLSLHLFAGLANRKGWSVSELVEKAQGEIVEQHEFSKMFQNLYTVSNLKSNEQKILLIFSVIPYQSYPIEELECWLSGFSSDVRKTLNELVSYGWLETDSRNYSMHPVIAESIAKDTSEEEIAEFLDCIWEEWKQYNDCILYDMSFYTEKTDSLKEKNTFLSQVLYCMSKRISCIDRYRTLFLEAVVQYILLVSDTGMERLRKFWNEFDEFRLEDKCLLVVAMYGNSQENCEKEFTYCYEKREFVSDKISRAFRVNYIAFLSEGNNEKRNQIPGLIGELLEESKEANEKMLLHSVQITLEEFNDKREETLRELQAFEPKNSKLSKMGQMIVWDNMMTYFERVRNIAGIEKALEKMESVFDHDEELFSSWSYLIHIHKGGLFFVQGKYQESVAELTLAKELVQSSQVSVRKFDNFDIYYYLSLGFMRTGRYQESEELIFQMLDRLADSYVKGMVWNALGVLYQLWEKWEKCCEPFQNAQKLSPAGDILATEAKNNLSKYYHHIGDFEKEQELLREAIPDMEKSYGAEDAKVVEAKSRYKKG